MQGDDRGGAVKGSQDPIDERNKSMQMRSFLKQLEREIEEGELHPENRRQLSTHDQIRQLMMQLQSEDPEDGQSERSMEIAEVVRSRQRMRQQRNIVAYTCAEAQRSLESGATERYINHKIEAELVEFKEEIERNFANSETRTYVFKRVPHEQSIANSKKVSEINKIKESRESNATKPTSP